MRFDILNIEIGHILTELVILCTNSAFQVKVCSVQVIKVACRLSPDVLHATRDVMTRFNQSEVWI